MIITKPVIRNNQYMYVDRLELGDIEVPERPSPYHEWDGSKWVENIDAFNDAQRQARASRYKAESDPMKIEAEYDALILNTEPDYTAWINKVSQIKAALPYK